MRLSTATNKPEVVKSVGNALTPDRKMSTINSAIYRRPSSYKMNALRRARIAADGIRLAKNECKSRVRGDFAGVITRRAVQRNRAQSWFDGV
jgi:hypothetical protein